MGNKKNLRRISVLVTAQTAYNLRKTGRHGRDSATKAASLTSWCATGWYKYTTAYRGGENDDEEEPRSSGAILATR